MRLAEGQVRAVVADQLCRTARPDDRRQGRAGDGGEDEDEEGRHPGAQGCRGGVTKTVTLRSAAHAARLDGRRPDVCRRWPIHTVMAGHSRSKNGVASLAY